MQTENPLQNAYIGEYVEQTILTYDFTQSDAGWTPSSGTLRDSNGFYRNGTFTDGGITAPTAMFDVNPNKLILTYNKTGSLTGTGLRNASNDHSIQVPRQDIYSTQVGFWNGSSYDRTFSLGGNPTGEVEWVVNIDRTTTPRTITHNVGRFSFSDTSGYVDSMWSSKDLFIRIVNRSDSQGMHIMSFAVEY